MLHGDASAALPLEVHAAGPPAVRLSWVLRLGVSLPQLLQGFVDASATTSTHTARVIIEKACPRQNHTLQCTCFLHVSPRAQHARAATSGVLLGRTCRHPKCTLQVAPHRGSCVVLGLRARVAPPPSPGLLKDRPCRPTCAPQAAGGPMTGMGAGLAGSSTR
jgi:hypothetical protein